MPNAKAAEQPTPHAAVCPRPMGLGRSLLFFGLPTAAAVFSFYVIMPALIERGVLPFRAHSVVLLLPLAGLLFAALLAYRLGGDPFAWPSLAERFRWRRMDGGAWLWTLGIWILQLAVWFGLQKLSVWLITTGIVPMPQNLPAFLDRRSTAPGALSDQAAGGLEGNWGFVITSLAVLFFNIAGKELWWRG